MILRRKGYTVIIVLIPHLDVDVGRQEWVKTYYYHIFGNKHPWTNCFRVPTVPGRYDPRWHQAVGGVYHTQGDDPAKVCRSGHDRSRNGGETPHRSVFFGYPRIVVYVVSLSCQWIKFRKAIRWVHMRNARSRLLLGIPVSLGVWSETTFSLAS